MKFDKMCYYVLKEGYKDKFIAIAANMEEITIPPEDIVKISKKPQVSIKDLSPNFVKKLAYELNYNMLAPDEISRVDSSTQFTKEDAINLIARKVRVNFNVPMTKANQAGLQLFRIFIRYGILLAIAYKDTAKTSSEDAMKAIEDPESDWLASGLGGGSSWQKGGASSVVTVGGGWDNE